ncbi:MAG TPA: Ig-like domain-containing protein [Streptosporangiaceae bacterium]|nr:Ig-like domain-containing protein [Streptosporangiaceae bacterium]
MRGNHVRAEGGRSGGRDLGRAVRWTGAAAAVGLLAGGLLAAGYSGGLRGGTPSAPLVSIGAGGTTLAPGHGIRTASATASVLDRRPDLGVTVRVTGGRLTSVRLLGPGGQAAGGILGPDGASWHTSWALAPAARYRVTAVAVGRQGTRTVAAGTFRTLAPQQTFHASTALGSRTYGVGMPVILNFSSPVTNKAAAERALQLWSSKPVTGAWYWMGDQSVWFRPRSYWPAHTSVRFVAHLRGVQAAPGRFGSADLSQSFRIGDALVARASAATHVMKVWYDGRLAGSWPVSTGQPGLDTPDGHYLSFAMGNPVDMNSATFGVMPGDPGYYNVMVHDSVQFTYDGDYVHSAPWSVAEQGYSNVSHGCVNLSPADAAWFYGHSLIGDPITIVGSPRRGTWGDGWTIWFRSWRELLAGSATGRAVLAGPGGSRLVTPASGR